MSVYSLATDFVTRTNRSVFITGKAGTGKTTFLHRLRDKTHKQMAVVAPTGVAAINAGGVTMHSFFQLPLGPFFPTEEGRKNLISRQRMNRNRRNVLRELELLVIDEISMVRADLLDAVDTVLRSVRHRQNEPFGGVQLVFIGDMFQLSPVAKESEWRLLSDYYDGVYFFYSQVLKEQPPVYIEFDKIFRQSDSSFIKLLNQIRSNTLSKESYDLLQTRHKPNFRPHEDDFHITLTTHNYKADAINREELDKLSGKSHFFEAVVKGDFSQNAFPAEESLELKAGARVMFVKNDNENPRRYYNGKIGVITVFDKKDGIIYVKSDEDEDAIAVSPSVWENIRYVTDAESTEVKEEISGTFTQYPLRLAWAVTIHKSQGLTFDKAVIDAGASFAPGQVYVALSRCRTLEGITMLSPINSSIIRNDEQVLKFSSRTDEEDKLTEDFKQSSLLYKYELLQNLFNFEPQLISSKIWYTGAKNSEASFTGEILPYISSVIDRLDKLSEIGRRFTRQLKEITLNQNSDENYISERLQAASDYFSPLISQLSEVLKESPATTDNRKAAREYDGFMQDIFVALAQKQYMMKAVSTDFSIENYFSLRKSFTLPVFNNSSYSRTKTVHEPDVEFGDLLSELIEERNRLADELELPVYIIATVRSLKEMAYYLPLNEKDMMRISDVGKKRFERFGNNFLDIIVRYCEMNELESKIDEIKSSKAENEKKPKRVKGASAKESFTLFNSGVSIAEIAKQRELAENTIAGHLGRYIQSGELDIHRLIASDKLNKAEELIAAKPENASLFETLNNDFNQVEITLILALRRSKKE